MSEPGTSQDLTPVEGDEEISMNTFKVWCCNQELKPATIAALVDNGFDSVRAISVLQGEDLADMNIPNKAQVRLLQAAVNTAKSQVRGGTGTTTTPPTAPPSAPEPAVITTQQNNPGPSNTGLTIDNLLSNLASADNQARPGTTVPFRPELDPTFHLMAEKSSGNSKPLEIIDFVGLSVKFEHNDEQIISELNDNNSIILKTNSKKPKYENLTVWQWALGAIRIQDELVRLGKLCSDIEKRQYWGYTCKVLELNTRFEWQSVLEYDKEYRKNQARFDFPWGTEIPHLTSVQLKDKRNNFQNNFKKNKQGSQPTNSSSGFNNKKGGSGQQLTCRDFNRDKCTRVSCKYQHTCSVSDCGKNHPASQHDSNSKN